LDLINIPLNNITSTLNNPFHKQQFNTFNNSINLSSTFTWIFSIDTGS